MRVTRSAVAASAAVALSLGGAAAAVPSGAAVVPHGPAHSVLYTLHDPLKVAGDSFGHNVAISSSGKTVLVGAYGVDAGVGAAYLYTSAHHATPLATFKAPVPSGAYHFGYSVALSPDGTVAYVGADKATVGTRTGAGAVYVYKSAGGKWPAHPTYTINDPGTASNDFFSVGVSVSPDGNTLVVGAPGFTVGGIFEVGRAYVYTASRGKFGPTPSATISSPVTSTRGFFGYSVSVSKDTSGKGTAIVGAYVTSKGAQASEGAAYVFDQKSAHVWSLAKGGTLADPGNLGDDFFGGVVTIDGAGTLAMVGAQDETEKTVADAGAVFTYVLRSGTWKLSQTLDGPADGAANFASPSVSANGAVAVMGAANEQVDGHNYSGEAFVYDGTSSSYHLASSIPDPTGGSATGPDYFGAPSAESQNGDTAVIGAPATSGSASNPGPGAVYVYNLTP